MMLRHAILLLVIGATPGMANAAAPLGRLFFTPAERAVLDRAPAAGELKAQNAPRTLNGIVRRSDGQATVWIDGKPQALRLNSTGSVPVETGDGDTQRLKVGESTDTPPPARPMIRIERHR